MTDLAALLRKARPTQDLDHAIGTLKIAFKDKGGQTHYDSCAITVEGIFDMVDRLKVIASIIDDPTVPEMVRKQIIDLCGDPQEEGVEAARIECEKAAGGLASMLDAVDECVTLLKNLGTQSALEVSRRLIQGYETLTGTQFPHAMDIWDEFDTPVGNA